MLLISAFFCLIYILFFFPTFISHNIITVGDNMGYFIPAFYTKFVLWESSLFSGFPTAFDPQTQSFYPIKIVLQSISLSSFSYNIYLFSAYFIASYFTYGYVFQITKSKFSGLVSGIFYGLSMALVERIVFISMVHTVAWLPAVLWGIEQIGCETNSRKKYNLLVVMGLAFMLLAGHPQSFVYCLGIIISYVLVLIYFVEYKKKPKYLIYNSLYLREFFLSFLMAVGFSAALLIPQIELMRLGSRKVMDMGEFNAGSLHPFEIINFIYPYLFGGYAESSLYSSYFGYLAPHEVAGYTGVLSIFLTFLLLAFKLHKQWQSCFWFVWIVVSLALAFGGYTPISKITYLIPGYNLFRVPSRHTFETAFSLAVLAGISIHQIQIFSIKNKRKKIVKYSIAFLCVMLLLLIPYNQIAIKKLSVSHWKLLPWNNFGVSIPLFFLIIGIGGIIWLAGYKNHPQIQYFKKGLLLILIIFDLASASWFGIWRYHNANSDFLLTPATLSKYRTILDSNAQRIVTSDGIFNGTYSPNLFKSWGLSNAGGYNPLMLARYSSLLEISPLGEVAHNNFLDQNRTLDILACKYVTILSKKVQGDLFENSSRWTLDQKVTDTSIYENKRAMPRAWLVNTAIQLRPEEIINTIKTSTLPNGESFDPKQTALVETAVNLKLGPNPLSRVSVATIKNEFMQLKVETPNDTFLVISDVYYPGWKATIDDRPARIIPTDYVLRGIPVPAGTHTIELRFRPSSFYLGLGISSGTIALMLWLELLHYLKYSRKCHC